MLLFNLGLGAVFIVALAIMLDQNRLALARIVAGMPTQNRFDDLDTVIVEKCPARSAGFRIRQGKRLGYKEVMSETDKTDTTYIVFRLCPAHSGLMPHRA